MTQQTQKNNGPAVRFPRSAKKGGDLAIASENGGERGIRKGGRERESRNEAARELAARTEHEPKRGRSVFDGKARRVSEVAREEIDVVDMADARCDAMALWAQRGSGRNAAAPLDFEGTGRNAAAPLGTDRNVCSPLWRVSEVAWAVRCEACARVWRLLRWRLLRWRLGIAARKVALALWAALYAAAFAAVFAGVGAAVAWCAAVEEDCDAAKAAEWQRKVTSDK